MPDGAASVEQLTERLRLLQAWSGMSYRAIHREVVRARAARGVPEQPVLNTIYRCFQAGRTRLDIDLVVDIARVLLNDETDAERWRQACWVVAGLGRAAAIVTVADTWPDDLPAFTGRRAELQKIVAPAENDHADALIFAITGMPGVGKTRLAVHAGHLLMRNGDFTDVRLAVDLRGYDPDRPPADPGAVLEGFLRRLGLSGERIQHLDLARRAAKYRQLLAGKKALVLLDNAASAEQVGPLLPVGSGCCTLITSRRVLSALPAVRPLPVDVMPLEDAVDLLRRADRSGRIAAQPEGAAGIAELLERLPLALALVASRIEATPDWTLADHLDRLVHHQRTLRVDTGVEVALNLSYQDLTADQQRTFRLLALHPGNDVSAYAAAALAGADLARARDELEQLTAANLLQRAAPDRYRFHNLINIYATARSQDEDPASAHRAALARLSDYYLYTAGLAIDIIYPHDKHTRPRIAPPATVTDSMPDEVTARRWLDVERANLLAVATHPEIRDRAVVAFSATLHRYLAMTCQYSVAEILHRDAVTVAGRQRDSAGESGALVSLGDLCQRTGRYDQAIDYLETALATARVTNDLEIQGRAFFHLAYISMLRGRYQRAAEYNRQSLDCYREIGNQFGELRALGNLGWAHQELGLLKQAIDYNNQAMALCVDLGDEEARASLLDALGAIHRLLDHHEQAAEHHRQALALFRSFGDREGETGALDNLGLVAQETGRLAQAVEHHQLALAVSREIGDQDNEARALNNLGMAFRRTGRYEQAKDHHERALRSYRELDNRGGQSAALNGLGELARATGDLARALRAHAEAHQYASKIGQRYEQARADVGLGHAHHGLGNTREAREHWGRALATYEELGVPEVDEVSAHLVATGDDR